MSDEPDTPPSPAAEPNAAYTSHYLDHISATRTHLADDASKFKDSFYPPTGYWTASEKSAFFYALSTYSRLRPDLIAAHIRSKTVVDVVVYLEYLRQASKDTPPASTLRAKLPAAADASDELVAFEEEQAVLLAAAEPALEAEALEAARSEETRTHRNAMRVRRGQGTRAHGGARDRESERARRDEFAAWQAARTQQWQRDDFLAEFDGVKLALLDAVLRGDDPQDDGDAASVQASMHTEGVAERPSVTPVDDALIDPALLAESRSESQSVLPSTVTTPPPPCSTAGPSGEPTFFAPQLSISTDLPAATQSHNADDPQELMEQMSPASRRRFQKRLYMRRKRAGAKGVGVSTEPTKMKPGRKGKQRADSTPAPVIEAEAEMASTSANGGEPQKKPNKGGKTRYEKTKEGFEARDIDADVLQREGLDLFHYGALGRLMRIYAGLHEEREGVETLVSGETLRTLQALVEAFVRELVRRAVVSREQEQDLKSLTKAWRLGEKQVVQANVAHALEMMGMAHLDKRSQLASILSRFGIDEAEDGGAPPTRVRAAEPDYDAADAQVPINDAHHQMYAPFVRVPGIELPAPSTAAAEGEVSDGLWAEEDIEELCAELDEEVALNRADVQAGEECEQALLRQFGLGGQEEAPAREKTPPPHDVGEDDSHESGKKRKRRARDADADADVRDQQRKKGRGTGMYVEPDGIRIKSAVFVDSDEDD